jgi:hypothetical protein
MTAIEARRQRIARAHLLALSELVDQKHSRRMKSAGTS